MRLYRDDAVVLRQHKLGEADRIVTLLTRQHGLVRAVAKGVRRTKSKFGARLEPFAHIDVQLYPGRNLDIVTQVQTLDAFGGDIVDDYGRYTTACAVLETAERLAGEERAPAPRLHQLTVGALRAVGEPGTPRRADSRRVPAAGHGLRGLGAGVGRVRPVRGARSAPGLPRRRRRRGVRALPPARRGHPVARGARPDGRAGARRLGAHREPPARSAARPAGWSPRTCSGTWNDSCAPCR